MKKFFSVSPLWLQPGLALIRIILGLFMVYHGWEVFDAEKIKVYLGWDAFKGFSLASVMVYMGKIAELIGGIFFCLGIFTRLAAVMIAGTMLYITFFVGLGRIWYQEQHPFLFVLLAMVFFFTGPGNFSLDKVVFKK